MGGDFENTISGGSKSVSGTISGSLAPQATVALAGPLLRYHKSGNEIHFHDDANKIKAAIPAAEFYNMARRVRAGQNAVFFDKKNRSLLTLALSVTGGVLDYNVSIERVNVGATAANLEDFFSQLGI